MIAIFIVKILALGLLLIFLINIVIYKIMISFVLKKFIHPYLYSRKQDFINTRFVGLFKKGDFGKDKFVIKPVPEMGNIANTIFFYVYAVDHTGEEFQYTVKVSMVFLFIRKVILKSKKENIEIEL
ncbi:MAG: hypothetical protein JNL13_08565 [Chitinophagaceae bacterium]|nr:hypothetical protein [Chitinophagaceae bacterium]